MSGDVGGVGGWVGEGGLEAAGRGDHGHICLPGDSDQTGRLNLTSPLPPTPPHPTVSVSVSHTSPSPLQIQVGAKGVQCYIVTHGAPRICERSREGGKGGVAGVLGPHITDNNNQGS